MAALLDTRPAILLPSVVIEPEPADAATAREVLLDRVMGPARRTKSSERLRRGQLPAEGLSFVARDDQGGIVGTVRLWNVFAGIDRQGRPLPALLLGPLAVEQDVKGVGIGSALMRHSIAEAARLGHRAILLVGDAPYYARFGFSAEKTATLTMPGPFERGRFLALELVRDALAGAAGMLVAAGRKSSVDDLPAAT